jgi:hypothetical protein
LGRVNAPATARADITDIFCDSKNVEIFSLVHKFSVDVLESSTVLGASVELNKPLAAPFNTKYIFIEDILY